MAKNMTGAQFAAKWASRAQAAGDAIKNGVQSVTENPAAKAIAAKDKYLQGVQDAAANGKYEKGLGRVTLEGWKAKVLGKGLQNYSNGVREAQPDMAIFGQQLLDYTKQVSAQVKSMPSTTAEDRIQRMIRNAQLMSQFKRS